LFGEDFAAYQLPNAGSVIKQTEDVLGTADPASICRVLCRAPDYEHESIGRWVLEQHVMLVKDDTSWIIVILIE
jgi:hypothetical protein